MLFRKAVFNSYMKNTLDQSQETILSFNTNIPSLTLSAVCIYQFLGWRLRLFPKIHCFSLFPTKMANFQNLTLPLNRSRSTQGHNLNRLRWTGVLDAKNQAKLKSDLWFQRIFLSIYRHVSHLGHVTPMLQTNFFPYQRSSTQNLIFILSYISMAAILVMWLRCCEHIFVLPYI